MAALASNVVPQSILFSRQNMESTDGSISMDSSDHMDRDSPNIDNDSCSSDDTVLSVGNENPPPSPPRSEPLSFKNIESHLNAISKITNSTLNRDPITNPSSPINSSLSPSSTKSLPKYCFRAVDCDKSNHSDLFRQSMCSPRSVSSSESSENLNRSPRYQENSFSNQNINRDCSNNDPNNGNLKFSIDNILKADFGRRITDPLNIRKSKAKKVAAAEVREESSKAAIPVDLSKNEEKEEKKEPLLWPAWVYCTRYSDRPSSGMFSNCISFFNNLTINVNC